jgi:hypothetical protein
VETVVRISGKGPLLEGKGPVIIQENLDRFVTMATMFLSVEVQKRTPQGVFGYQGGLISTVQTEVRDKGTPIVKGIVASNRPQYDYVIEKGREPGKGMPPKGTLVRWLEVKLNLSETEAQRIEYVVRRKIGQKGFEGVHMFEYAVTENLGTLETMAEAQGLQIAKELGNG